MRKSLDCLKFAVALLLALSLTTIAQTTRVPQKRRPTVPAQPAPEPEPSPAQSPQQVETLQRDTNLVTIPVVATDRNGLYVPDAQPGEFTIFEDGAQQNIAFFSKVSAPFHVVLMLDTSGSTEEKLQRIQSSAIAFVEQLQPADRVAVISFDDEVRELNSFTSDRAVLKAAILKTHSGQETKLYDALGVALDSLKQIAGRKAIVLFTDGVDHYSDRATYDGTLYGLDEEGVIVYPIRYATRADTERSVRGQSEDTGNQLPTLSVIRSQPSGTNTPTFPNDEPDSGSTRAGGGILGLPSPAEIERRRRESERNPPDSRRPTNERVPPSIRGDDPNNKPANKPGNNPAQRPGSDRPPDDPVKAMLDPLYVKADAYLQALSDQSGGRLLRADTLGSLPDAFARIAAELRTQYSIGYYPTNATHDGLYRKIKVSATRKDITVRAKPGYRAPRGI